MPLSEAHQKIIADAYFTTRTLSTIERHRAAQLLRMQAERSRELAELDRVADRLEQMANEDS